jgi:hypothetical protein
LELPGFPVVSSSKSDIQISRIQLDKPIAYDFQRVLIQRTTEGLDCIFPNAVKFNIVSGEKVVVSCFGNVDPDLERIPMYGFVLAALFSHPSRLIVHGSCVEIGGKATIIAGDKYQGKSTLIATLIKCGHRLISDDVTILSFDPHTERVEALPSIPVLKLWPSAACAVGFDTSVRSTRIFPGTEKRRYNLSDYFCREPVELNNIFFLETSNEYKVQKITGAKKIIFVNASQYFANYLHIFTKLERSEQFGLCHRLAMGTEAYNLRRPKNFDCLNEVRKVVEEITRTEQ